MVLAPVALGAVVVARRAYDATTAAAVVAALDGKDKPRAADWARHDVLIGLPRVGREEQRAHIGLRKNNRNKKQPNAEQPNRRIYNLKQNDM